MELDGHRVACPKSTQQHSLFLCEVVSPSTAIFVSNLSIVSLIIMSRLDLRINPSSILSRNKTISSRNRNSEKVRSKNANRRYTTAAHKALSAFCVNPYR